MKHVQVLSQVWEFLIGSRDGLVVDETLIVVLSDGPFIVAEPMDSLVDGVDQTYDDDDSSMDCAELQS